MELLGLALFAAIVAVAIATPGPTVILLVARVLATGRAGHGAFCVGLVAGDVVWLAAAVFGMAALAEAAHGVFVVLKYAGCAYLLWLAYSLWTAPAQAVEIAPAAHAKRAASVELGAGLAVALSNPKTMVFYLALVPNLIDTNRVDALAFAELATIVVTVYGCVLVAYVWAAGRARRLFGTPRAMRRLQRGSAVALAGTAAAVAARG
jgi:threonine/homoserine/homoserine lactone efflux protein